MLPLGTHALTLGAAFSALAALAHLVCIVMGAPAYRIMGAGEKMARAAEAGKLEPTLVTLVISAVLLIWAAYALSGAGVIARLPWTKFVLIAICAIYLLRSVAFPFMQTAFPDNSTTFWLVSSGICLVIGLTHLYGLVALWTSLR